MSSIFYKLGEKAGRSLKKGQWLYKSVFGTEEEAIQAEFILGQELAHKLESQIARSGDPAQEQLVQSVGRELADRLTNSTRRWRFSLLPGDEINAFALPGGFIYATQSLLQSCRLSRQEVAFVLGHEIGHVVRGHPFDRVLADSSLKVVSRLGRAGGLAGNLAKQTLTKLLRSSYSQDQELDADLFGLRLMVSAGYPPDGAITALRKLQETASHQPAPLQYFASHPAIDQRVREIEYHIRKKRHTS